MNVEHYAATLMPLGIRHGPGRGAFHLSVELHNETTLRRWAEDPPTWEEAREVFADELVKVAADVRKMNIHPSIMDRNLTLIMNDEEE